LPGATYSDLASHTGARKPNRPHGRGKASKRLLALAKLLDAGWKRPAATLELALAAETLFGRLSAPRRADILNHDALSDFCMAHCRPGCLLLSESQAGDVSGFIN
jgi:hypothetical protein